MNQSAPVQENQSCMNQSAKLLCFRFPPFFHFFFISFSLLQFTFHIISPEHFFGCISFPIFNFNLLFKYSSFGVKSSSNHFITFLSPSLPASCRLHAWALSRCGRLIRNRWPHVILFIDFSSVHHKRCFVIYLSLHHAGLSATIMRHHRKASGSPSYQRLCHASVSEDGWGSVPPLLPRLPFLASL